MALTARPLQTPQRLEPPQPPSLLDNDMASTDMG